MGFYNVVRPCVVGKLHYATVPSQPIEVDDVVAAPLVESGCLAPYDPLGWTEKVEPGAFAKLVADHPPSIRAGDYAASTDAVREAIEAGVVQAASFTVTPVDDDQAEPEKPAPRARNPRRPKG